MTLSRHWLTCAALVAAVSMVFGCNNSPAFDARNAAPVPAEKIAAVPAPAAPVAARESAIPAPGS